MSTMQAIHSRIRWPLVLAFAVIVVRVVLEQLGAPESINNVFGVAWFYLVLPVYFALRIRKEGDAQPAKSLFLHVLLFAVYTRLMVMVTYMLAYAFQWQAPRFLVERGGNVGEGIGPLQGYVVIPLRNALFWVVAATVAGMVIGGVTLLIRRGSRPSPAE